MKKFRIYWLHGGTTDVEGLDIADAFTRSGFGAGAVRAVDYYEELK